MPEEDATIFLHSKYDPEKEACRFVHAQNIAFYPAFLIISEPGKSYLASVLRQRFPQTVLVALRYTIDQFIETDSLWDFVWRPDSQINIEEFLFNLISDEYIPLSIFLAWKPSDIFWPEISQCVWEGISSVLKMQKSIMFTRSHFGKKWLTNMFRNTLYARHIVKPGTTSKHIFLAASGPSLEKHVPVNRKAFYICTVSSSLCFLKSKKIEPDLCIATDGGYWALAQFRDISKFIPLVFPLEAALPHFVLEKNPLSIVQYGSELEKKLLSFIGISGDTAFRNGTVSGTAAQYCLSLSSGCVYAAGLDFQNSCSFTHARPHVSDILVEIESDRLNPLSTSLYSRNVETASLEMYASWFASRNDSFRNRFFRLYPAGKKIQGIVEVHQNEVTPTISSISQENINLAVNDSMTRKIQISAWIDHMISVLSNYKTDELFSNTLYNEIMQMVSYTDYIQLLKKYRSLNPVNELPVQVSSLINKTIGFLQKMKILVIAYE